MHTNSYRETPGNLRYVFIGGSHLQNLADLFSFFSEETLTFFTLLIISHFKQSRNGMRALNNSSAANIKQLLTRSNN